MSVPLKAALIACLTLPMAMPAMAAPLAAYRLQLAQSPNDLPPDAPTDLALEEEATVRHAQLQWHQGFGLATLGSMALTTGLGAYTSNFAQPAQLGTLRNLHMALGGLTTGLYLGAATLALTTPGGYEVEGTGWDSVSLHRYLAWLHGAGIGATFVMGVLASTGSLDRVTHGVVGGTTLGLMALSAGVIVLDF